MIKHTNHVMLASKGAERFASVVNAELVDNSYFNTEYRLNQVRAIKASDEDLVALDHSVILKNNEVKIDNSAKPNMGTVGAVAVDAFGNIAAATSTGGMTNKKYGRVGDSPIIGAGKYLYSFISQSYANNETCAVSCTGHGEYMIKTSTAFNCHALMKYKGLSLVDACNEAVSEFGKIGGTGGLVAIDRFGNIAMPFNTEGMYRGWQSNDVSEPQFAMYGDEPQLG